MDARAYPVLQCKEGLHFPRTIPKNHFQYLAKWASRSMKLARIFADTITCPVEGHKVGKVRVS